MLSNDFIQDQKTKLLVEKAKIEQELGSIAEKDIDGDYRAKYTDFGDGREDNASELEQYQDNLSVEHNLKSILDKINAALARIDANTYGQCIGGDEIEQQRLQVLPWAEACIEHSK